MKNAPSNIDLVLPHGELIRGFANQNYLTRFDLNRFLKSRGVFCRDSQKEILVPILATLLLSPSEFDDLRECQNTKEDNIKKTTSRIECESDFQLVNAIKSLDLNDLIDNSQRNFSLISKPIVEFDPSQPNKASIHFEIERTDLNKSWYESSNIFNGQIEIEKSNDSQLILVKSYTSNESDLIATVIQQKTVQHLKSQNIISAGKELTRVLFGDFTNEDRIVFFYRLSSNMNSSTFEFKDIINVEITPDEDSNLPGEIHWMKKKTELKFKGSEIHETFFVRDKKFHKHLKFWEMESSFKFDYLNYSGHCNVTFSFKDFLKKGNEAEFEINLSSFRINDSSNFTPKEKTKLRRKLLDLFDKQKEETYSRFLEHLKQKNASA